MNDNVLLARIQEAVPRVKRGVLGKKGDPSDLTVEDLDAVNKYVWSRFPGEEFSAIYLFQVFQREFARGDRCMVCGRTESQNEALGYDCWEEC